MSGSYTTSAVLTDSISSLVSTRTLRSSAKSSSSFISRTYKQASHLFLTRRLSEALQALEPLILPRTREGDDSGTEPEAPEPALIANGAKPARIKVWNLYITLLNAIVELGSESGKAQFGSTRWKSLAARARDGSVWEDVVRDGYHGREGRVDADVVSNLATLLLSHSPSQHLNQQRLEAYLSTSGEYTMDVSDRFDTVSQTSSQYTARPGGRHHAGTNTPRDLNSRLKVIELYALHVLPRNEEWDYAEEFINMSDVLDEEKRDLFLQYLHTMRAQSQEDHSREAELQKVRDEDLEKQQREEDWQRQVEARKKANQERLEREGKKIQRQLSGSEQDYGIDDSTRTARKLAQADFRPRDRAPGFPSSSRRSQPGPKRPPDSVYKRGASLVHALRQSLLRMAQAWAGSPSMLLRTLLFAIALLAALSRRDSRELISRLSAVGWQKLKQTVGMGIKVSYV